MSPRLLVAFLVLAAGASAQFTVSGNALYQDKEWDFSGWTGADPNKPIRRADVTVLNNATSVVLGTGTTGQDGSFAVSCSGAGSIDVVVRVDADTDLNGSFQRIRVTTEANVEYSVLSPVFPGHAAGTPLNVGTLVALPALAGADQGGPFNLLDLGVSVFEFVTGPAIGASTTTTVRIFWPSGGGSFASGNEAHIGDDDGFDDSVALHEVGHVVHSQYSDSDSPGGGHTFGDSDQDPLLSLGEGYATFFAGQVLDQLGREALYVDSNGSSQSGGWQLRLRLETCAPFTSDSFGAADEGAVACTLFDLTDTELSVDASAGVDDDAFVSTTVVNGLGLHRAWWDVFTGPVDAATSLNLNHCWDGWLSEHVADPHYDDLKAAFDLRRMRFYADAQEPDNTSGTAVPTNVQTGTNWVTERQLYFSSANPPAPGTNDEDWYAHTLVTGSVIDVATRYPDNVGDADTQADVQVELWNPAGALVTSDLDNGAGRNALIDDFTVTSTGTWKVRVRSQSNVRRYGRYEYRARYVFENHVPTITSGPLASPGTIEDDETALLSVTAADVDGGQTLAYAWTPLDGGSIVGSGASVTFDPPAVGVSTAFDVQLVVNDNLGAVSVPGLVTITVNPSGGGSPCGAAASVTTGGVGKPGLFGTPMLAAENEPQIPSSDFALSVSGAHPSLGGSMIFGFANLGLPFDGGTLYPSPNILIPVASSVAGTLLLPLPLPSDPLYCGIAITAQAMFLPDPGAAGGKQTAQTNFVTFTFGS